jgi:hypothetical protein
VSGDEFLKNTLMTIGFHRMRGVFDQLVLTTQEEWYIK